MRRRTDRELAVLELSRENRALKRELRLLREHVGRLERTLADAQRRRGPRRATRMPEVCS